MPRSRLPPRQNPPKIDTSLAIVNIVLLLILFFLATGSLVNSPTLAIDLAKTERLPIEVLPKPILVLDADGGLSLNGAPTTRHGLYVALRSEATLYVLVDGTSQARRLLELLEWDELVATEIRLVTLHTANESPR